MSHAPSAISSMRSLSNLEGRESVQVTALVGEPALCLTESNIDPSMSAIGRTIFGPAILHPSKVAKKGMSWSDFSDIRVRRALTVGMSLQQLQHSFFLLHKRDLFGPYCYWLCMMYV